MKLVFLDMEKSHVLLFSESGMTPIAFEKIYTLKAMLKNEPVIYVSDAVVTNASEITNLVNSLRSDPQAQENYSNIAGKQESTLDLSNPVNWSESEEPLYIHPTSNKRVLISDMGARDHNNNISGFTFQGYLDFQSLSYLASIGFNDSHFIHTLIGNGTLEVVPQSQVEILKASYVPYSPAQNYNKAKYAQKQNQYNQHNRHQSMIVDSHESVGAQGSGMGSTGMDVANYSGGEFKGDDIIPIDLGGGINFKTSGGGGQYGNEGRLID